MDLNDYILGIFTTLDNVDLEYDIEHSCLYLRYKDLKDTIRVTGNGTDVLLTSECYPKSYSCSYLDFCINDYIEQIITAHDNSGSKSFKVQSDLSDDEIDDTSSDSGNNFARLNIDRITSDLSTVVISKLVFEDNLIGYRFRLNNGCLDISIEKGKELGIVPYKIGKRVPLTAINGVLASKYECNNKVLFPDISNDDELCRRLLEVVLS